MPAQACVWAVELIAIYESLCDPTRLRILNLLTQGPLCVCHFQEVLAEPQVKISKHLKYLRSRDLVSVQREGNWMIYSLPANSSHELSLNLACLQECAQENALLKRDLKTLTRLKKNFADTGPLCCAPRTTSRKPGASAQRPSGASRGPRAGKRHTD
jgi:ArsR family transcriptional regulator